MRLLGRSGDRSDLVAAEFAAILDGRTLWLAVAAEHGPLVLRDRATDAVVTLGREGDDPAYWSTRHDLRTLHGHGDATYDVESAGGPVAGPAMGSDPLDGPTCTPAAAPDAFALETAADGALRVVRTGAEPAATVAGITVTDDATVQVRITGPEGAAEPDHVLLVQKGTTVAEIAVVDGVAALPPDVTGVPDGGCRLVAASGTTTWPLRRRNNDLVRPQAAVQLPTWGPGGRFELLWAPSGDLRSRPTGRGS